MTTRLAWLLALGAALLSPALGARGQGDPTWREPFEPFQIADNLYYVGSRGISSFLLIGTEGSVLIDTGLESSVPLVRASIEKLGFKLTDIRVLLSSHAHFDHVAGHAEMQRLTGARVMALGDDAQALASGKDLSALGGPGWTPVKVDRVLADGEVVSLGNLSLTANHTPGHTKGCTTWTTQVSLDGASRDVVFIGGTSINAGVRLLGNTQHPKIAEDYGRTFERLRSLKAQIFLAQHPRMFGMEAKLQRLREGAKPSPFLDPEGYQAFVAAQEKIYRDQLAKEQAN
jgi:metallo-beta-lactamase class B